MLPLVFALTLTTGVVTVPPHPAAADTTRRITQYKLERWTDEEGLPQNSIWAVAQTRDRFLWLASEEGLIRFDGENFHVFNAANTPALSRSQILALAAGPTGRLWIGTAASGVLMHERGVFKAYTTREGMPSDYVQSVAVDSAGVTWAGTNRGLARIGRNIQVINKSTGLPDDEVTAIAADPRGGVWVGTKNGLVRIVGKRIQTFGKADGLRTPYVRSLAAARRGGVWIGVDGGAFHFDGRQFSEVDATIRQHSVFAIQEDKSGAVWMGTNGHGLHRWLRGRLETLTQAEGGADLVWSLLQDADGSLWAGTNGSGLMQLRQTPLIPIGAAEGLSGEIALAVLHTRNGDVWIGTAGAGLNRISRDGRITQFGARDGLKARLILSLAEMPNGDVLIGSANGSLTRFRNGTFKQLHGHDPLHHSIMAILPDGSDGYWLGSSGAGLIHKTDTGVRVYRASDGLADDFVMSLERVGDDVWVGTRGGLSLLRNGRLTAFHGAGQFRNLPVGAFAVASDGSLLAATHGNGVARLTRSGATFMTHAQGLCDNMINGIVEDGAGNLWLSSNRGVFRVMRDEWTELMADRRASIGCTLYDTDEGMRSRETNGGFAPSSAKLADGKLLFPTMRGVVVIDPRDVRARGSLGPVALQLALAADDTIALTGLDRLTLRKGVRNVELRFTSPAFQSRERLQFRFKLDGFDEEWQEAGVRRSAHYTNLPPGEYSFRASATSETGVEAAAARMDIIVPAMYYETWWFITGAIIAVMALAVGLHRLRTAAVRRNAERLAAVVEERTRAQERYRDLFENATDMVFTTDVDGNIRSWNMEAARLTGYSADEVIGRPITGIIPQFGSISDMTRRDVAFERKNGSPALIEVATRVIQEDEVELGYQVIARDIYEWNRIQQQLHQAQKMEAIGRLAGGIAHDFNNLLTVIRGNAELIQDSGPSAVEEIVKATDSASALTQQLLAFSRSQILQPRALDLNVKIDRIRSMLERLIGEDIQLITNLTENLPRVRGDRAQVEQIIINMVVNARDAMPDGGRIEISTRPFQLLEGPESSDWEVEPGDFVELTIRDNGCGMTAATQARIFEPFFTTKEAGRGTGLGLATVYGAVKQSGGHIVVRSEEGAGTEFRIYFPLASGELKPTPAAPTAVPQSAPANDQRILLVEDETAVRNLADKVLRRAGFNVLSAGSGEEALRMIESSGPVSLVVTDIVMPDMNGRELAQRVLASHPDIRILYMSGYTEDEVIRRGVLPDGEHYLGKPFTPAALVSAVTGALLECEQVA